MRDDTRYATKPPNCAAMEAANKAVWEKYPNELDVDPATGRGRPITMGPKDAKYRKPWMDAYIANGGKFAYKNPKLKPGELKTYCGQKEDKPKKQRADLIVIVLEIVPGKPDKPLPQANVRVAGIAGEPPTDSDGRVVFRDLEEGKYTVHAWKHTYQVELAVPNVLADRENKAVIRLRREIPGNVPVKVVDKGKPVERAVATAIPGSGVRVGGYAAMRRVTDRDGDAVFNSIRPGRYTLSVDRSSIQNRRTDSKDVVVQANTTHPKVVLTIQRSKQFGICVASCHWYTLDIPPVPSKEPGASVTGMDVTFDIWCRETNGKASYFMSRTTLGMSWLGNPFNKSRTTGPGPWVYFEVPDTIKGGQLDQDGFGGGVSFVFRSVTKTWFNLTFNALQEPPAIPGVGGLQVSGIEVGPADSVIPELPGGSSYSGRANLQKQ